MAGDQGTEPSLGRAAQTGFVGGASGCLGVIAAGAALFGALFVLSQCSATTREDRIRAGAAAPEDLDVACAAGAVDNGWRSDPASPPHVVRRQPPMIVQCGVFDEFGRPRYLLVRIHCPALMESRCVESIDFDQLAAEDAARDR